ncbi:MAG: FecR domain-containing protein [Dysgonamonadaceae bacterium]|jgi:hypothetical protein|nr:FecR domain-containing protein [Dysgonamonadaceae bacterium]
MQHTDSNIDYSKYEFEDFLQNEFFISSIKNKNADSEAYWKKLENEGKINLTAYCAARNFIESLDNYNNSSVDDAELSSLWKDIQDSNRKIIYRKLLIRIGSVAASIAAILLLAISLYQPRQQQDIMSYARKNIIQNENKDIQIILSESKTLKIEENDANIVYDSAGIKTAQQGISKKELTAYNQLIVPKGKRSNLILSDGSKLVVNAGTRVIYPVDFSGDKREIYVDGEIFIDVVHDGNRPFIVKTSDMDVRVLGTKFNVTAYESDLNRQITLVSGSVEISGNNSREKVVLSPSEMYEYSRGYGRVSKVDVNDYISWIEGLYIFKSIKLEDVMARLSHYYGVDIVCSEDVAQLKCSGKMDLKEKLEDVFEGFVFAFPVKIEYVNGKYNVRNNNI